MVKRKYPGLIILRPEIIISILLCPTLWSETSKSPSIVSLNNSKCGSFVETVVLPWFLCEFMFSTLVYSFQLCKFLIKALYKECFMLAQVNQTIRGSYWYLCRFLFRLRIWRLFRWCWLCFLLPQEIIFCLILFLFFLLLQVVVEKVKLL